MGFVVGVGVGVGVGVRVGVGVGVALGVGVGDGVATATPLFHTNFLPDLMQVYVLFKYVVFWFTVLHALPGVTFCAEVAATGIRARESAIKSPLKILPLIPITKE
jgi:hypothetical protein